MSFTSISIVRKHLLTSLVLEKYVIELPITLENQNSFILPDANLVGESDIVKWKYTVHPSLDGPLELIDEKSISIKDGNIVSGSVVVTIDDGLETIYSEEKDYQIDYTNGSISRIDQGIIPNNQLVSIHYEKFDLFTLNQDYTIDYERGYIARTANSQIPDGATVLIDYTVSKGSIEDEMIEQAIIEASDIVIRSLSQDYSESSSDQGLTTGTTLLSLSIVARSLAARVLTSNRSSDSYNRAREWQSLSTLWEKKAWEALGSFLDHNQLRSPVHNK